MEIFAVLNKSNCRECGEKTCLAFAGAVYLGKKPIHRCPYLTAEEKARFGGNEGDSLAIAGQGEDDLGPLKKGLVELDFAEAASRCGGAVKNGWLSVPVLGKEFRVNKNGNFSSDIHVNNWVAAPFLLYVLHCQGKPVVGEWISYREVEGGRERYGLFNQRVEEDLRKVADGWPDLFKDMVESFQGRQVASHFEADVSVVLRPLPLVPVMICYWQPDEGLDSTLNIFFDKTVNDNLGNDGIYTLSAGLANMFAKLAERHGRGV